MTDKKKSFGLVATVVYSVFSGIVCLPLGFIIVLAGQAPGLNGLLFTVVGLLIFVLGVVAIVGSYGLWSFQEWGRRTMLWLYVVYIPLGVVSIFPIWPKQQFTVGNLILQLVGLIAAGLIVFHLSRPATRTLFTPEVL
jgi:uncharacterized membrane protein (DUF2068 family)